MKFICGLTLGILLATSVCYADSQDKLGGVLIGVVLGISLVIVTLIMFCQQSDTEKEKQNNERKDYWWRNGETPPWEND